MYAPSDYLKAEFRTEQTGEPESMWARIDSQAPGSASDSTRPCAQGRCATKLRYAPTAFILHHFRGGVSARLPSFDTAHLLLAINSTELYQNPCMQNQ
jgi:hypothetical protein